MAEIVEGMRFLWGDRLLLTLILTFAVVGMLAEPVFTVILPVYAREVYGSAVALGVMYSGLAAGALVGNVIYIAIGPRLPRRMLVLVTFTIRALVFWLLIPFPPALLIAGAFAVVAIVGEPLNPLFTTILQERVPAELRGRVFGVIDALAMSVRPLGFLVYGVLIDAIGLRETLIVLAAVNLAVPVVLLFLPVLHDLRAPSPLPDAAPQQPG
jgi:MFS family permease